MYCAIIIVILILLVIYCATKCPSCNCSMWCPCAGGSCCCSQASVDHFAVNDRRQVTFHYTDWCVYCKQMKPVWEQVKKDLVAARVEFKEVNEDLTKTPGINEYPTIMMITESGRRVKYMSGPQYLSLRNWIISPSPY